MSRWTLCLAFVLAVTTLSEAQQPTPTAETVASEADAQNPERGGGGFVESMKDWAQDHQIAERLSGDVDGWYPRLGGMTRGGGFALGPGYRFHAGNVLVDLGAGVSTKLYKSVEARVRWLQVGDDRLAFWTDYRFEDFPQEDFWGMGADSAVDGRTSYRFRSHDFVARGVASPVSWFKTGINVGLLMPSIGAGRDKNYPSIEERFTDIEAPGLGVQPDYLYTSIFADADTRDVKGHPRSGGLYRIAYGMWNARDDSPYDFRRFDANATHFVPLVPSKDHMVFGRVGIAYVNNDGGHRVPFYFLPYVGGVDTVRSYREFRFKDENALWMSAEYNYGPIKWVSFAAFVDGGKVAHDWNDINVTDLRTAYGVGVRGHTNKLMFLRVDLGLGGDEGRRLFFKAGTSF